MRKLFILSLEGSEQNLHSKITEIVNEAGISTNKIIDQEQRVISIGGFTILPTRRKVLKRN